MNLEDMENSKKKEKEIEDDQTIKTPVADYATATMSKSLVTGVSNIVETKNRYRKFFKTAVLLCCTAGFFYQATAFVLFILTYPSVVDIDVYIPHKFIRPAYTICNNNGIKRSKFCSKYPEKCYTPDSITEFCKHYRFFCSTIENTENLTIVKPEFYNIEKNISFEELKELGHDTTFIESSEYEKFEGPYMMRRDDGVLVMCYTKFLRVNSSLDAEEKPKPDRFTKILDEFSFNAEPQEVFMPARFSGMLFNLHSPFVLEDPFENGIFVRLQRAYMIHLRLEEEHLLPYPYRSNCKNYTEEWLARGRTGIRSQEACHEKCELDMMLEDCNCSYPEIFFPFDGPICTTEYDICHQDADTIYRLFDEYADCAEQCRDDCLKFKFRFDHQQRLIEADPYHDTELTDSYKSKVVVIASDPEVMKLKYRPQYQNLEVFSNLGGFIGAWLGVSLVAIMDLFESLAMIGHFAFLKNRSLKRNSGTVAA